MTTQRAVAAVTVILAAIGLLLLPSSGRAAYPPGRFSVNALTAVDSTTGLMWQRGFAPSQFGGTNPTNSATAYCEGLTLDGRDDWRLPSAKELMTLFDPYEIGTRIDGSVFTPASGAFHSSSFVPNQPTFVYTVTYVGNGAMGIGQNNFGYHARCVRTLPTDGGT